ncbi:MAG TPA: hypothetical protein GX515_03960 [Firmicutes bacterium]|nr:hypothetical protein [Bacillota bacterium]
MQALRQICERNGVGLCYLFGSQAENAYRMLLGRRAQIEDPLTDIDVGVVLLDFDRLVRAGQLHVLHAQLYGSMADLFVPFDLDLVLLQEGHSVFQFEAVKGICVYEASARFRGEYEEMVARKAADFRYVLETYLCERTADLAGPQEDRVFTLIMPEEAARLRGPFARREDSEPRREVGYSNRKGGQYICRRQFPQALPFSHDPIDEGVSRSERKKLCPRYARWDDEAPDERELDDLEECLYPLEHEREPAQGEARAVRPQHRHDDERRDAHDVEVEPPAGGRHHGEEKGDGCNHVDKEVHHQAERAYPLEASGGKIELLERARLRLVDEVPRGTRVTKDREGPHEKAHDRPFERSIQGARRRYGSERLQAEEREAEDDIDGYESGHRVEQVPLHHGYVAADHRCQGVCELH